MMWLLSALSLLLANGSPSANTSRVWLVVAASDKSPATIAVKARGLAERFPRGLVFATADCGEKARVFGFAAELASDPKSAEVSLARVRTTLADAYLKRCDVLPQSLLAHRVHVVDPSIAGVPSDAVNWEDEDRISTLLKVDDKRSVAAIRYFESSSEDPLEGKRTRLALLSGGSTVALAQQCATPTGLKSRRDLIAVTCVVGQAADNLLHEVLIFGPGGRRLLAVAHCREPRWTADQVLQCSEESVDADGVLKVTTKRVTVDGSSK